jgi:TPR repeat protein
MSKAKSICYLIAVVAGFCATQGCIAADDGKQLPNEASQRMLFYQEEASKLSTTDVFKEIQRQQAIQDAKPKGTAFLEFSEDTYKTVGYVSELAKRRSQNEPLASFYHGLYNWRVCAGLGVGLGQQNSSVQTCWQESLASYKVASNANIAPASFNIGRMYENGLGVTASKFAAAEWYVKAANQYNEPQTHDEALTSLEAALKAVPDLPAALRLKNILLK